MSAILKQIIPATLADRARRLRDLWQIRRAAPASFDPSGLRPADTLGLDRVIQDPLLTGGSERMVARLKPHLAPRAVHSTGSGDRRAVYHLVLGLEVGSVLEIGTWTGGTGLTIAQALADGAFDGRVTTVDLLDVNAPDGPWRSAGAPCPPAEAASRLGLSRRIQFRTADLLDWLADDRDSYDLIFLDGSHQAGRVYAEVAAALPRLRRPGLVLLHDYYPEEVGCSAGRAVIGGPRLALARVMREQPGITVMPVPCPSWSTATSLAVLARAGAQGPHLPGI